jgi:thioredoxin reductase (NADPH)
MYDLIIVGGGPAGLAAGLYASRGGLKNVLLFEKEGMSGGQITQSSEIENYPGINKTITGLELMETWPQQAKKFGLQTLHEEVVQILQNSDNSFTIKTSLLKEYNALSVLVATGNRPKNAGIKGEYNFFGKGVSTCATCDAFFYRNKEVAVLGGGDSALEEALHLTKFASKVYLIHRKETFKASPSTVERIRNCEKIHMILNTTIEEIIGDSMGVTGLLLENIKTKEKSNLEVPGVFIFVGRKAINYYLKQDNDEFLCAVNEAGEVITDIDMHTSIDGLYAAGDIRACAARQVVCAAGDGATAALRIIDYIDNLKEDQA